MSDIGVFLKPGGNKVFFVNGVLKVFEKEGIPVDHLIGYSSSSAIVFSHLFSCHDYVLDVFGRRLRENKKNFYFLRKEKFPHDRIYNGAIQDMFVRGASCSQEKTFSIIAARSNQSLMKIKGFAATGAMCLEEIGIGVFPLFRKIFGVSELCHDSRVEQSLSRYDAINLIMGSSMIYPFINLYTLREVFILDGALMGIDPDRYLKDFDKKIIIHTKKGETCVKEGVLHIHPSQRVPNNILNYTDDSKIRTLQQSGEDDARKSLDLIKEYVST